MERKQIPARLYYYAATMLTPPEIPVFADQTVEPLFQSAQTHKLEITGPAEYIYLNVSKDPAKPFNLMIAFPVSAQKTTKPQFGFLETPPFECLCADFKGPMPKIGQAWDDLVGQVLEAGYIPGNQGREVYKDWRAFDSDENVTELQMGWVAHKRT